MPISLIMAVEIQKKQPETNVNSSSVFLLLDRWSNLISSVSWFMSALSEYIARRSNYEDNCSGRFFEGRFACREIASEGALLVCGMYVDLNQIRAGEDGGSSPAGISPKRRS